MSEANYDRLVKLYGKAFADACIVELDNYKGRTRKDLQGRLPRHPLLGRRPG